MGFGDWIVRLRIEIGFKDLAIGICVLRQAVGLGRIVIESGIQIEISI